MQTPYVRLMAIPGINIRSAADLEAEMGPISGYANSNAIIHITSVSDGDSD
ncbi:MAG: hypothetical protein KDB22_26800 [Planctomycetales bacterium]|nr:hypothetical protein [Planctomycetales bacterium]